MTRISRSVPTLPESRFAQPIITFETDPDAEASCMLRVLISERTQPNPSRLRLHFPSALLQEHLTTRQASLACKTKDRFIYAFDDFSAVFVAPDPSGEMAVYPFPLHITRFIRSKRSRVATSCETPHGVFFSGSSDKGFRADIEEVINALDQDWSAHPEFDPHYREGGCDIPWVAPAATVANYNAFRIEMTCVLRAFEAYIGHSISFIGGTFRSIEPNGEISPLDLDVWFPNVSADQADLHKQFGRWVAAAMDPQAHRQVSTFPSYDGRMLRREFELAEVELTSHEVVELIGRLEPSLTQA
jgi:hypothetical protein